MEEGAAEDEAGTGVEGVSGAVAEDKMCEAEELAGDGSKTIELAPLTVGTETNAEEEDATGDGDGCE
jgi:hypothetical protein